MRATKNDLANPSPRTNRPSRSQLVALIGTLIASIASCSSSDGSPSGTTGAGGAPTTTTAATSTGAPTSTTSTSATSATTTSATSSTGAGGAASTTSGEGGTAGAATTGTGGAAGTAAGQAGASTKDASPDATPDAISPSTDAPLGKIFVYVSGYGNSIVTFEFDPTSGSLTPRGSPTQVDAPSYLTWTTPARRLYALSEVAAGRVYAFSIDAATGALTPINDTSAGGAGPALVYADPSGKWVFSANYDGNTATVLPIQPTGGLGAAVDTESYEAGSFPHAATLDSTRQFAYVLLKGAGMIAQYKFDGSTGKLTALTPPRIAGGGPSPRHIAMHPSLKVAYVIDEEGSSMTAFNVAANGTLASFQTLTTRAATGGGNTTAEVMVHASGKWLYGSNRGDDNIVQYALSPTDGKMTLVGNTPSGGSRPQCFAIDPTGQFVIVANQGSDNLVLFRLDADGKMQRMGNPVAVTGVQPTFVGAAVMP